jgi:predicted hotdog family 3-hydroxylacyl-ACP dehydratase
MPLSKAELAALIPHAGAMCLLDGVTEWDGARIACSVRSHRDPDNPLRSRDRLHVLCGVEYAAQAMAVHGALLAKARAPTPGFLAAVRDLAWTVERLDDLPQALRVEAERLIGDASSVQYAFRLSSDGQVLLSGRASIFFLPRQDTTP